MTELRVGFIGLGRMGYPMALNLTHAGVRPTVWTRSPGSFERLHAAGAVVASTAADVFRSCDVVFLMLANGVAIDDVLQRGTARFTDLVEGTVVVHMGTTAPAYSRGLADDIAAAAGRYVEAPVSGSRQPAEHGELVAMVASDDDTTRDQVVPLLQPMCAQTIWCGRPPMASRMKLAVNTFLITMVTGLAEAFHFADRVGLDRSILADILDAGPMASSVSRTKTRKLVDGDLAPQAALADVAYNTRLIRDEARAANAATPLVDISGDLFVDAEQRGCGELDMAAVIRAIEARADQSGGRSGWRSPLAATHLAPRGPTRGEADRRHGDTPAPVTDTEEDDRA